MFSERLNNEYRRSSALKLISQIQRSSRVKAMLSFLFKKKTKKNPTQITETLNEAGKTLHNHIFVSLQLSVVCIENPVHKAHPAPKALGSPLLCAGCLEPRAGDSPLKC